MRIMTYVCLALMCLVIFVLAGLNSEQTTQPTPGSSATSSMDEAMKSMGK